MSLKTALTDREFLKFREVTHPDKHAVAVVIENADPVPVEVTVVQDDPNIGQELVVYDESLSVVSSIDTVILSYTVPVGKIYKLKNIELDGTNKAIYTILVDSVVIGKKVTYFTKLNEIVEYSQGNSSTVYLSAGQVLDIKAIHSRPVVGDFFSTVKGWLIDA